MNIVCNIFHIFIHIAYVTLSLSDELKLPVDGNPLYSQNKTLTKPPELLLNITIDVDGNPVSDLDEKLVRQAFAFIESETELYPFPGYDDDFERLHHEGDSWESENDLLNQILSQPPLKVRHKRAFFKKTPDRKPWPDGKVFFAFDKKYPKELRTQTLEAMADLMEQVPCVHFLPADPVMMRAEKKTPNTVIFTGQESKCSVTGIAYKESKKPKTVLVNLAPRCFPISVYHELMHLLGAIHTQARPDRDHYVTVNFRNIKPGFESNFKKLEAIVDDNDYEYDYSSTMHYGPIAYAVSWNRPTISVAPNRNNMFRSFQKLSENDIKSLKDWYGCGERCPFAIGKCDKETLNKMITPAWSGDTGEEILGEGLLESRTPDAKMKKAAMPVTEGLLRRLEYLLYSKKGVPPYLIQLMKTVVSLSNDPDIQKARRMGLPELSCKLGPWYYWDGCETSGIKYRVRKVIVNDGEPGGERCPETSELLIMSSCRKAKRSIQEGREDLHINKTVSVLEGQNIVLAVRQPANTTVRWFNSSGVELTTNSSTRISIIRTSALNNILVIDTATLSDNQTQYTSTISTTDSTTIHIHWTIEIISFKEFLVDVKQFLMSWIEVLAIEEALAQVT